MTVTYDESKPAAESRKISNAVARKYGYFYGTKDGEKVHVAVYKDPLGADAGLKVRTPDKQFSWQGRSKKVGFFGQHLAGDSNYLTITEGEIDAMSVATANGMKFPVVSLPDGAQSAEKVVKAQIEWLRRFKSITLAFDMDEPGQAAAQAVAKLLPAGVVKIAQLPRKDANEVLMKDGADKLKFSIIAAREYAPDALVFGDDLWERFTEKREAGTPYPFAFLNDSLLGRRPGEIITILAGSGVGKSTLIGELETFDIESNGLKIGVISLEDSVQEAMLRVVSMMVRKNLITDFAFDPETVKEVFDKRIKDNVVLYDPQKGWDSERVLEAIRWMIVGQGCKVVYLDHLSATTGAHAQDDQTAKTEELCYGLRALMTQHQASLVMVCHLRKGKTSDTPHEEGGRVTMQDAKGSGAIYQVSNTIIAAERNTQAEEASERDVTTLRILKGRLTGVTGEAGRLIYDRDSYRLKEYERPSPFAEGTVGVGPSAADPSPF